MYIVKWISTDNDEIKERAFDGKSADEVVNIAKSIWCMLNEKERRQHRVLAGEVGANKEFIKIFLDL